MKIVPILIFFISLTSFSQGKIENLKIDWPEEYKWAIGTNQENESMHMVELIPKSQTLQDWKIIATMISIKGLTNVPMDVYIELMYNQTKQNAPKAKLTVLEKDETGKNHWALFTIESPRFNDDPTPESQIYYVIQGDSAFYTNLVGVKEKKLSKKFIEKWSTVFKASELIYRDDFETIAKRTEEHIKMEEWDKAEENLNLLIEYFPGNSSLYFKRGYVRLKNLNYKEGIEDFTKVIEITPETDIARTNRGYAYRMIGEYDKAISDFKNELEINPNAYSYEHLSMVYYLKNEYTTALDYVNTSIDQKPENAIAYKTRALIYKAMNIKEKACKDKTTAIELGILEKHPSFTEDILNLEDYCKK